MNAVNWDAAKVLWDIFSFLFMLGVALYAHMRTRHQVTESKLTAAKEGQDKTIADHAERITRLEGGPTHQDMSEIHDKLNQMNSALQSMAGEFRGTKDLLSTVHRHLLDQH